MTCKGKLIAATMVLTISIPAATQESDAVRRGRVALFTRTFNTPIWSVESFDNAWKFWQPAPKEKPADYDKAFRDYYGLHPAPFDNGRYPLGLREGPVFILGKGLTSDCLICHGGSIFGTSYVGLGNSALDIQAVFDDLDHASGRKVNTPFRFTNVRGTSEAAGMAVYLLSLREPDLSLRLSRLDFELKDDLCEDTPAWWLLKKKKTMYHTGTSDARSVRSIMQFMLSPTNTASTFDKEEETFRDIQSYILNLQAPQYPLPIDRALAAKGQSIFTDSCAKCHGTYGDNPTYPSKVVPIADIGTDRKRFEGLSAKVGDHYNKSWFAREKGEEGYKATMAVGYQAPPLDGVWATAPYFHNGAAPTLMNVLDSKSRPKLYTRTYQTDRESYDEVNVGWKITQVEQVPAGLPPIERRKYFDTTQPGRSNGGHTFGDALTPDERRAVVEYLKTL